MGGSSRTFYIFFGSIGKNIVKIIYFIWGGVLAFTPKFPGDISPKTNVPEMLSEVSPKEIIKIIYLFIY